MPIKVQPFVIDEAVLDLIGKEFRFDHAKGLAEWIKNSCDAYLRERRPDEEQEIIVRITENGKQVSRVECIDFVGMRKKQIDDAFKRFFDPTAAKKGAKDSGPIKTLGGHGNGGKFYMRQMFKTSKAVTFRDGKLNIFGFNVKKQYGFEEGFEDKVMPIDEALKIAGLGDLGVPDSIRERLGQADAGFTVVIGEGPEKAQGTTNLKTLIDKLILHPQARRLIDRKPVSVVFNQEKALTRLVPPRIEPKEGFEAPIVTLIPEVIDHDGQSISYTNARYPFAGRLVLKTSSEPLRANLSSLNTVDFLGEVGVIATYRIHELGASRFSGQVEFIYGECECPILEDPEHDCVSNDRQKLVAMERSQAIQAWVRDRVEELAEKIETKTQQERRQQDLKNTSVLNEILNRWKERFMSQVWTDVFSGQGPSGTSGIDVVGGPGGRGDGGGGGGGKLPEGQDGGSEKVRKPRFPQVLVSGQDSDPLDPLATTPYNCDPRHPAVYQRFQDVPAGIYWINTSRPLAEKIIGEYSADSPRWREYLFQRYVEIISKEAIWQLGKQETSLSPDDVIRRLDDVQTRVHDQAAKDLVSFLFSEQLGS